MTQSPKDDNTVPTSSFSSLKDDERPATAEELEDIRKQYPTRYIIPVTD